MQLLHERDQVLRELSELVKALEDKFGVVAAAPAVAAESANHSSVDQVFFLIRTRLGKGFPIRLK